MPRLGGAILVVWFALGQLACGSDGPAAVIPTRPDTIKPHSVVTYAFRDDSIIDVTLHATDNVAVTRVTFQVDTLLGYPLVSDSVPIKPGSSTDARFSVLCPYLRTCRLLVFVHDAAGNFDFANHSNEDLYAGPIGFNIRAVGLPANGVVNRIGVVLTVDQHGTPFLGAATAYLDSGTPRQHVYGSGGLPTGTQDLVILIDAIPDGPHTLSVDAVSSGGIGASWHASFSVAIASVGYHVRILSVPGAVDTRGMDLNNTGDVAGVAAFADSSTTAIRWDNGTPSVLPGGGSSSATAINDGGDVAGAVAYARSPNGSLIGDTAAVVVWQKDGTRRALTTGTVMPRRIAANGDVLLPDGRLFTALGLLNLNFSASDMNDLGLVIGTTIAGRSGVPPAQATTFRAGVFDAIPLFSGFLPSGSPRLRHVNNLNQITGTSASPGGLVTQNGSYFYTWSGLGSGLDDALNNRGQILGHLPDGSGIVWTIGGATTRVTFDALDWTVDAWTDINDRGQILAHAVNSRTGQKAALLLDPP